MKCCQHKKNWSDVNIIFFFKKVMNEETKTKTRKKNGAHTNSCTTVQLDERNIHVGCCLFSHNKQKITTSKYYMGVEMLSYNNVVREARYLFWRKNVKKKRSTHACTHNCAAQWTQYSRRLLSILARPKKNATTANDMSFDKLWHRLQ